MFAAGARAIGSALAGSASEAPFVKGLERQPARRIEREIRFVTGGDQPFDGVAFMESPGLFGPSGPSSAAGPVEWCRCPGWRKSCRDFGRV